jgi:choline-sulfatase
MTSPGPAAPISPISPISTTRSAEILDVLDRTRQEAIVVFVSDHGDMLGERGMWFKMSFFEGSARVPLMISVPGGRAGRRVAEPTSQPRHHARRWLRLAGVSLEEVAPWTDGESLVAPWMAARAPRRC